jgi:hypothetical protein
MEKEICWPLPRAPAMASARSAAITAPGVEKRGKGARILVVEDVRSAQQSPAP